MRFPLPYLLKVSGVIVVLGLCILGYPAQAQSTRRCFAETGYCIDGRMREFWEENGGLAVFGLPIMPQQRAVLEGQPRQVQWFERARLELHPENAAPYDVQIGRLGIERLQQQNRNWWDFPASEAQNGCQFFPETRHQICGLILNYWRSHGLELDGLTGKSAAESLALFGMPVSDSIVETLSDGQAYTVQWFERARFELHPTNPEPVLLGLLGQETHANEPPDSSIAPPVMACLDTTISPVSRPAGGDAGISPHNATLALSQTSPASSDVECPPDLSCTFIPAYYGLNDSANLYNYGNYSLANRPRDAINVSYIVIHDTEEDYNTTVSIFQNPAKYVSSHYVVNPDGSIVQMVRTQDIAWHGGNSYVYDHAIGIEHVGFALEGATAYTDAMYRSSARLVQYLSELYNIPLNRAHIIGHDEIPGRLPHHQASMHWDPGPFWNWGYYMQLLGAALKQPDAPISSTIVTINPDFATNTLPVTTCGAGTGCRELSLQGTNFVYLHSAPDSNAPLISNPYLIAPGTDASNWGNKARVGQQFYRIDRQGDWDAIYFGGEKAWFYNPGNTRAMPATGTLITPRKGRTSIPAYGYPYPEPEAYPPGSEAWPAYGYRYPEDYAYAPGAAMTPIYELPAGQTYVVADLVKSQYVSIPYAVTREESQSVVITGKVDYYQIFFNHRFVYVRADEVDVLGCESSSG